MARPLPTRHPSLGVGTCSASSARPPNRGLSPPGCPVQMQRVISSGLMKAAFSRPLPLPLPAQAAEAQEFVCNLPARIRKLAERKAGACAWGCAVMAVAVVRARLWTGRTRVGGGAQEAQLLRLATAKVYVLLPAQAPGRIQPPRLPPFPPPTCALCSAQAEGSEEQRQVLLVVRPPVDHLRAAQRSPAMCCGRRRCCRAQQHSIPSRQPLPPSTLLPPACPTTAPTLVH